MPQFRVVSDFGPTGDQGPAIKSLSEGIIAGKRHQTLLGVTGSGKTFTIAKMIEKVQRPTLVIAHNKTLAAQLYSEFKEFFPDNAVEYFVSYYDYYQPEAYIPATDTYIEKDSSINKEIDRLRLAATRSLMERQDVIVVASVSCIYGLGSPKEWRQMTLMIEVGQTIDRKDIQGGLVDIQYERNDVDFTQGVFRVRGDTVEVFPAMSDSGVRIELFGDEDLNAWPYIRQGIMLCQWRPSKRLYLQLKQNLRKTWPCFVPRGNCWKPSDWNNGQGSILR